MACTQELTWGVDGYGQRHYLCAVCGEMFGIVDEDDIEHDCERLGAKEATEEEIREFVRSVYPNVTEEYGKQGCYSRYYVWSDRNLVETMFERRLLGSGWPEDVAWKKAAEMIMSLQEKRDEKN